MFEAVSHKVCGNPAGTESVPAKRARRVVPEVASDAAGYFCQVRFLWRLARSCLRRLCLLIFDLRRFFSEPIMLIQNRACLIDHFVKRILNDALCPGGFQLWNQLAHHMLVDDGLHGHPTRQTQVRDRRVP